MVLQVSCFLLSSILLATEVTGAGLDPPATGCQSAACHCGNKMIQAELSWSLSIHLQLIKFSILEHNFNNKRLTKISFLPFNQIEKSVFHPTSWGNLISYFLEYPESWKRWKLDNHIGKPP